VKGERRKVIRTDSPWFRFLHSTVDTISNALLGGKRMATLDAGVFDTGSIGPHEGIHRIANPRYKEWWYYDMHLEDGTVVAMSVVFSVVRTHWFVWVYDPATGQVSEEIMADGRVVVNACGGRGGAGRGLSMTGPDFSVNGSWDRGYRFEFRGKTVAGVFDSTSLSPGRAECHRGVSNTRYGLYQVPRMSVTGTLERVDGAVARRVSGVGYHDHWWCIAHRITRWNWMQAKFPGGWALAFYDAAYGYRAEDSHRYGWLLTPAGRYEYFDTASMKFERGADGWTLAVSGPAGSLRLEARPRVERYEFKPVLLAGLLLGEVQYFQYPVTVKAVYTPVAGAPATLESDSGMLEWDWLAVW
jgi:hypothetical protein